MGTSNENVLVRAVVKSASQIKGRTYCTRSHTHTNTHRHVSHIKSTGSGEGCSEGVRSEPDDIIDGGRREKFHAGWQRSSLTDLETGPNRWP